MKKLLILIALFIAAIFIAPMLIDEKGYILIKMGDSARETTVTAAVAMLLALFFVLLFTLSILKGGIGLSIKAWNTIAFASRRKAARDFSEGISAYVLGDYQKAEHLMNKCATPSKLENLCYLVAASAAEKQSLSANTKHYLAEVQKYASTNKSLSNLVVEVQLLLNLKEFKKARKLLDDNHKSIGHDDRLYGLEIDLSLSEARFAHAIELLTKARKNKHFSTQRIEQWESAAFSGHFDKLLKEKDQSALLDFWNSLSRKEKARIEIIKSFCFCLANNDIDSNLNDILLPAIKKDNNPELLAFIGELPLSNGEAILQEIQKKLHKQQDSYQWLSLLAHCSYNAKQFEMAEKAFNSMAAQMPDKLDKRDYTVFAKLLQEKQEFQKANQLLLTVNNG